MYRFVIITISFLVHFTILHGQENMDEMVTDSIKKVVPKTELEIAVDSMATLMRFAEASGSINEKEKLAGVFQDMLIDWLKKDGSFGYSFEGIPHVGIFKSPDSLVRIFSWSIPTQRQGVFQYHGIIQHRAAKTTHISDIFILEDTKSSVLLPEHEVLKYPKWYGCLYYQLIQKNDGKNTYYTLIGHDFNDGITFKKCIDVLTFDKKGIPVFGAPLFMLDKKPQYRVLFEYSSQSVMKAAYFEDMDKIVFNYLYPIVDEKVNDKRYYVPDASYEGLMFRLGKWIKIPNVDMSLKE